MELDQAMDLIKNKKFSKIPVYSDTIDNIEGILYAKDIIPYLTGPRSGVSLLKLSREPFFVPETKPIDDLLEDFRNRKTQIAIVVDEWGGTAGLVTVEDIVEEVLGQIQDPYDTDESLIFKQKDSSMIIDAKISIYDLQEEIEIDFPESVSSRRLTSLHISPTGAVDPSSQEKEVEG